MGEAEPGQEQGQHLWSVFFVELTSEVNSCLSKPVCPCDPHENVDLELFLLNMATSPGAYFKVWVIPEVEMRDSTPGSHYRRKNPDIQKHRVTLKSSPDRHTRTLGDAGLQTLLKTAEDTYDRPQLYQLSHSTSEGDHSLRFTIVTPTVLVLSV